MNIGCSRFRLGLAGLPRLLRRLAKAANGVETVEFALVSLVLFTFLLGVVEFGRLYWTRSELQYATEAAARYLIINPSATTSEVQAYAASKVFGISVPDANFSITPYVLATNTPACGNFISVSYTYNFIASGLLPFGPITLRTSACYQA
jgi:Flp pilus assembly protein TadG